MVAPEYDDCILPESLLVQLINHPSHIPVNVADAGQIGLYHRTGFLRRGTPVDEEICIDGPDRSCGESHRNNGE